MANLEDVLKNFDQRMTSIEAQLRKIEQQTPTQTAKTTANIEKSDELSKSNVDFSKGQAPESTMPKSFNANVHNNPSFNSSSMLAFIGIVFVILAGVFFIKITIDSGWLTPIRQILIATGTGLAFFFIPQFVPKAEREYGALLAGAGTTILHLTWLGAYFSHHIISAKAALICATLVGVFSILAKFDKGNRVYILVAMAGTYLSAPIIGYNTGELSFLSIFLIILNIVEARLSQEVKLL